MASSDALALPLKNTAFRVYFAVYKNDGTIITGWTGAAATLSKDGASSVSATNTPTEIATSWGIGYLDLTASEMNTNNTSIKVTVTNTSALPTVISLYPSTDAMIRVNVVQWLSNAVTALTSGDIGATIWGYATRLLTGGTIAAVSQVNPTTLAITINTGTDYNQTDYLRDIPVTSNQWPDLTGATIQFKVNTSGAYTVYGSCTITNPGGNGTLQTVHIALTHTQNNFAVNVLPGYSYILVATLSNGDVVELASGKLIVNA